MCATRRLESEAAVVELDPKLLREVLETLPCGEVKSRLTDAVLATMDPAQRWVMETWQGYVCPKCEHTMIANTHRASKVR
jgi:hypothetical protein